jgi:predicted ATPase
LLGAYRDNEVDVTHPLTRTLRSLESSGIALDRVALGPLRLTDLTLLIQHTLHSEKVEPLANLVLEKTGGNPFFVIQFLHALKHEGFLEFDYAEGKWHCRLDAIRRAPFTDNVIDLMTRKIQRLSKPAQRALTLAACIGNPFDVGTLAVVSEQKGAATDLSEAVEQGLVLALDNELSPLPPSLFCMTACSRRRTRSFQRRKGSSFILPSAGCSARKLISSTPTPSCSTWSII